MRLLSIFGVLAFALALNPVAGAWSLVQVGPKERTLEIKYDAGACETTAVALPVNTSCWCETEIVTVPLFWTFWTRALKSCTSGPPRFDSSSRSPVVTLKAANAQTQGTAHTSDDVRRCRDLSDFRQAMPSLCSED